MSTWGNMYYSQPYHNVQFPSNLFIDIPTVNITKSLNVEGWMGCITVTKDQITSLYLIRPVTAGANTVVVSIHAIGKWK